MNLLENKPRISMAEIFGDPTKFPVNCLATNTPPGFVSGAANEMRMTLQTGACGNDGLPGIPMVCNPSGIFNTSYTCNVGPAATNNTLTNQGYHCVERGEVNDSIEMKASGADDRENNIEFAAIEDQVRICAPITDGFTPAYCMNNDNPTTSVIVMQ